MPTPVKSSASTSVTIDMRERALGVGALPSPKSLHQVHPERKAGYSTYLAERRKLMASYSKALYASNDPGPAKAVQAQIRALDQQQQTDIPRTTIEVRFSSIARVGPSNYEAFFDVCETKPGKAKHCVVTSDRYDFDVTGFPEIYRRGQVGIGERLRALREQK